MSGPGLLGRIAVQVLAFAILWPAHALAARVRPAVSGRIAVAFHRLFLRLFDVRVHVSGTPPEPGTPTLVVANHVSWLDIPVTASLLPLSFVAKREVEGWPVCGFLARRQRCLFIDRARRAATHEVNAQVARRLADGDLVVLFPEGTTGDGNRVLPFRSSLVGAARDALAVSSHRQVRLQPLSIAYGSLHGLPITRRDRPRIAWYGDMDLLPHALALLRAGPLDVSVAWGEPVPVGPETDRKDATRRAETAVRAGLSDAKGRPGAASGLFSCRPGRIKDVDDVLDAGVRAT